MESDWGTDKAACLALASLNAVAEGFRHLGFKDDHEIIAAQWIVYDALYAYCQEMVRRGMANGLFK
jgi:hypothetical protein